MPVTLETLPPDVAALGNGVDIKIAIDDTGTHPEYKMIVYRIKDASGYVDRAEKVSRPVGGGDTLINLRDTLRGLVRAKRPVFGPSGVQNDNTILKDFHIEYGERVIDVTPGAISITDNLSDSDTFKVMNASNNIFDATLIEDLTERILSYRPKKYSLFPNSYDFMGLLGSGTITYTLYDQEGDDTIIVNSAPYDANIIPMNLNSLGADIDTVAYMTVRIQAGDIDELYTIDFNENCQGRQDDAIEIQFIEPLGEWSTVLFQTLNNAGGDLKFNKALINRNILNVADLRSNGGNVMTYKEFTGTYQMTREMSGDPAEVTWIQGFGASGEYLIRRKDIEGNEFWAKFIVTSINYNPGDKFFNASGELALSTKGTIQP